MAGIRVGEGYESVMLYVLDCSESCVDISLSDVFMDFIPREIHSLDSARKLIANLQRATEIMERESRRLADKPSGIAIRQKEKWQVPA